MHRNARRRIARLAVVVALAATACSSDDGDNNTGGPSTDGDDGSVEFEAVDGDVRGFDGTTIRVAALGIKSQLPGAEFGARGRIERFNADEEIPGVEIEFVEYAEDNQDPALALSEARRLVTAENVFAIVADMSDQNPGDYFAQQEVPYFGWGFDNTYCSIGEPNPDIWGFGMNGCLVPEDPEEVPDFGRKFYSYVAETTGNDAPTLAVFSSDSTTGDNAAANGAAAFGGAGFDVTFAEGITPVEPIPDYTPYIEQLLSSADGEAPDAISCQLAIECIPIYAGLRARGYEGAFETSLYSPFLVADMEGSVVTTFALPFDTEGNAGLDQMIEDVASVNPDQQMDTDVAAGYFSTDMFIAALKTVAEAGEEFISPANVRLAAANQTWEIEGLAGPTEYPASTVLSTPQCSALVLSDGEKWVTAEDYDCSDVTFPVEG